jgi:hypothetical protein
VGSGVGSGVGSEVGSGVDSGVGSRVGSRVGSGSGVDAVTASLFPRDFRQGLQLVKLELTILRQRMPVPS